MAKKYNHKRNANIELSKIVSLLGKILGSVIKEQEGITLYNKIEEIRSLSKASRGKKTKKKIKLNETKKFRQLISNIKKLKPQESLVVARSFNKFLNFSNLAESLDSVHKIDSGKVSKAQGTNEFTILEDAILRLLKNKFISKKNFYESAKKIKIDLVLTAHPTEVKRRTLIQKYTQVNNILEKFNKSRIFKLKNIEKETLALEQNLHEEITSIWKTDEIKRNRPTLAKKPDGALLLLRIVYGMLYLKYVLVLIKLFKIIVEKDYQLIFLQLYSDPGWEETEMVTQMSHQILLIELFYLQDGRQLLSMKKNLLK